MNSMAQEDYYAVERRRCFSCNGTMVHRGFRRNFLRYVSVFRCSHCRRLFEQETRGFQGFYLGILLTAMAPMLYALGEAKQIRLLEVLILFIVFFVASWPIYLNIERSLRARLLNKGADSNKAAYRRRRTVVGRVLCGDCRWLGLVLGIVATIAGALGAGVALLSTGLALFG